jgi:CDP-diacylglycerol--glycerol-3-phosphate 3-phosphatidyltransferase
MTQADWRHDLGRHFTRPITRVIAHTRLTPDALSWMGLFITAGAVALLVTHNFLWAGVVTLVGGIFDSLDGALARETHSVSRFGAILDSTLDRFSEGALMLGIVLVMARDGSYLGALLAGSAMLAAYMVSYIRARAEGAGFECSDGWFTRFERVIVLALGLIFNQIIIALSIIAALSFITAAHRLIVVWLKARNG